MKLLPLVAALCGTAEALLAVPRRRRCSAPLRAADAEEEKPMTLYEMKEPFTNRYSSMLTSNKKQGASQAMLYASGV